MQRLLRTTIRTKPYVYNFRNNNPIPFFLSTIAVQNCIGAASARHYHNATTPKKTSTDWVSENVIFQKYPKLLYLEQGQCKSLNLLNQVLSYIIIAGLHRNPFVMSRVLSSCVVSKDKSHAALVFGQIDKPNTFSWNTMIRHVSPTYYFQMLLRGYLPDKYTYPLLLQACGSFSDSGFVKQVHCIVVKFGFVTDLFVQNSLLYVFCQFSGCIEDAYRLFDEMSEKDVVSWTTLISGLVVQGQYHESLMSFGSMIFTDGQPNVATMVSVMSACASLGSLDCTRGLHAYLEKMGWVEVEVFVCNSLIDAYAKCGSMCCAMQIFHEINQSGRDTFSWTAIIAGLAMHGCGRDAIKWFSQMKQVVGHGVFPDRVTFIAVLSACAHAGLVDEGMQIFESMELEFGVVPEIQHYGCMVDLFGRAGFLEYAYCFMKRMPMEPNLAILGSLLSACRVHNHVELGEVVLEKINSTCEYRGGASVLLSNMYANENRFSEVVHVRKKVGEGEKMTKPPGQSWIEVKGVVHEFIVGEQSHPLFRELHTVLNGFKRLMLLH